MRTNEDVCYAGEQSIAEEVAMMKGMEAKPKEFVERCGGLREGVIPLGCCHDA
jgi:hypothetical protein